MTTEAKALMAGKHDIRIVVLLMCRRVERGAEGTGAGQRSILRYSIRSILYRSRSTKATANCETALSSAKKTAEPTLSPMSGAIAQKPSSSSCSVA